MNAALPKAPMIERAILGGILRKSELLDEVPDAHVFAVPGYRLLFGHLQKSRPRSGSFDLDLLIHRIDQAGDLDAVGDDSSEPLPSRGAVFLRELGAKFQPSRLAADLAELRTFHARREACAVAQWISDAASAGEDIMVPLTEGSAIVAGALEGVAAEKSSRQHIGEAIQRFQKRCLGQVSPMGIGTIAEIDHFIRGMHPGRVWVIGAYPSGGKSLLGSQFLVDAALEGHAGIYVTLEMPEEDQIDRMIIQASRVRASVFMDPVKSRVVKHDLAVMQRQMEALADAPYRVVRPRRRSLGLVLSAIRKAHREIGAKLAVVDYIQLLQSDNKKNRTREDEATDISHALQNLAGDLGITVMVLTQLNQDGDTKHGKVIEEDADLFLQILQDRNKDSETYKQHLGIMIVKDRHNGAGGEKLPLFLNKETLRFVAGEFPKKPEGGVKPRRQR